MKYYDTSALLSLWKKGAPPPQGITRPHTLSEWFHIQAGRGMVYNKPDGTQEKIALKWVDAAAEARRMFSRMEFVSLTGVQTMEALESLSRIPGLSARAVHDYIHIRAAELHNAEALVTLNVAEWTRLTKLRIELP